MFFYHFIDKKLKYKFTCNIFLCFKRGLDKFKNKKRDSYNFNKI